MKYKTLFRLLLKAIGVMIFGVGAAEVLSLVINLLMGYWADQMISDSMVYFAWSLVSPALQTAFALYLFFGGQWIVDKAIPSNRPYCPDCGYELSNTSANRCPECGTPFRTEDVLPATQE